MAKQPGSGPYADGQTDIEPSNYGDIESLLEVMRRLRDPRHGCPWDIQQDFKSISAYTVEEAYEVADAIERGDVGALVDELGDLLLQVVFHAQIGVDTQQFEFRDVVSAIVDKMIRRHPHVFGDEEVTDADAQTIAWETLKAAERGAETSALDGVTVGLPPLLRAEKLQKRAARVGFDWSNADEVFPELVEEVDELSAAIVAGDAQAQDEELGDLLFTCVNMARHLNINPEQALARANRKFETRFRVMEVDTNLAALDSAELEERWQNAKTAERQDAT